MHDAVTVKAPNSLLVACRARRRSKRIARILAKR
jgi:hypothetical protein